LVSLGVFSWAPFAWSAVRQRSLADAVLAAVSFVAVICMVAFSYNGGNDVAIWTVLLTLMLGGSVLAGVRTPRTESVRSGGKSTAVWLVTAMTVVYLAGAFGQSGSSNQDETTPPVASPAPSLSPEAEPSPRPAATVTETATPPDVPETEEEEEAEADDNGGTGGQDFDGQVGIQFGYACSPVGALGIAKDGRPAKCFMGKDGRARWGYDSNRG
jgi:hypothetical protein